MVARRSSKQPNPAETVADEAIDAAQVMPHGTADTSEESVSDTSVETVEEAMVDASSEVSAADVPAEVPSTEDIADPATQTETDGSLTDTPALAETPAEPARIETRTIVERTGPGFVPLVLGGLVSAGIGFGAAYFGVLSVPQADTSGLSATLENQQDTITALEAQISELSSVAPPQAETVDLSPLIDGLSGLSSRLDETATALDDVTARVAELEERPLFSDSGNADSDAMAAAVATLQSQLQNSQTANETMATELQQLATQAQESIAAAEARARQSVETAMAQAALSQLRIAVAVGDPFSGALADVAETAGIGVPEALAATAETGVPTLEQIEAAFPAAARAALPVAMRETAGEGTMDRLGAFLMGQIGGRSIEARDGDDPDAILSRVGAAVDVGDLNAALTEVQALPEAAQAEMADWVALVQARATATDALAAFAAALDQAE